jgi:membrane fusion protein, adhesin transport system
MSKPLKPKKYASNYGVSTLDQDDRRSNRYIVWITLAVLLIAIAWASIFSLDEVTVAQGKVITTSGGQVVQSLEPGILREILVQEGQNVAKGEVLLRLDDVRAGSIYREAFEKWLSLTAQSARLRAEAYDMPLDFPASLKEHPEVIKRESQAFTARKNAKDEQIVAFKKSLKALSREITLTAPLVKQGVVSEVELLRLQRQEAGIEGQIAELRTRYFATANNELVRVDSELAQTSEMLRTYEDVYKRTVIRAPMQGVVKDIKISTIGAVVSAGQVILEIIPVQEEMLVEAFVPPNEVAYLKIGQPATIKLSAFDFGHFGGLEGEVELISADALTDESKSGARATPNPVNIEPGFYKILIKILNPGIERKGMKLTPQPGMVATVDILTDHKTVLEYLFRPAQTLKEALRER